VFPITKAQVSAQDIPLVIVQIQTGHRLGFDLMPVNQVAPDRQRLGNAAQIFFAKEIGLCLDPPEKRKGWRIAACKLKIDPPSGEADCRR
jgi:hypothetical protein